MRIFLVALLAVLLGGCAGHPALPDVSTLLADARFTPAADPPRREEVFAVSPAMRAYLQGPIGGRIQEVGARRALFDALRQELTLDYDTATTRTAAQTFESRAGNCLSLVILSAALARELDLPVRYQSVHGYDTWSRVNGIAFLSSHVNLVLGRTGVSYDAWGRAIESDNLVIDFISVDRMRRQYAREIPESTVVAMFMNNRAAEILAEGDVGRAYWWAREALLASPGFVPAANTLAVIYRHHGDLRQAERALQYARSREPDNSTVLSNLVAVLGDEGRVAESRQVRARLEHLEAYPPFHFFDLGMAAMQRGDYQGALTLFEKEQRRMPYDDEVHFAAAVANLNLGQLRRARRELAAALENSTTRDRRGIYAAKLEKLKAIAD